MIIPGVQKPHWRPWLSQKACWIGWRAPSRAQSFDRLDPGPVCLDREHRARLYGFAVEDDGARAAVGRLAPDVGPRQTRDVADEVDEQEPGLDLPSVVYAVYVYPYGHRP